MSKTDNAGRAYATVAETKAGDMVEVDDGFTCIAAGTVLMVKSVAGELCIECSGGNHGLDGQEEEADDGTLFYVGLYPVKAIA